MTANALTICPSSVDEIRDRLNAWFSLSPKGVHSSVSVERISPNEGRLVIHSVPLRGMRFSWKPDSLVFEERNRRVNLVLDYFDVNTEVHATKILVMFKLRHRTSSRPLRQAISSLEKTHNTAFVSRALQAVMDLERELPDQSIEEATSAPNDYLVLLSAMKTPSVITQLAGKDPLASAKLRGVEAQQNLLKTSGGVLSVEETAQLLGISRQAVDKRRRQGQLLGLTQGRRGYAYPAWQFDKGRTIANLEKVLKALRSHDPWMQLAFFLNPNDRLGGDSPADLLRAGDVARVISAAQAYGEQGAA
jgi:hypothetical protein